MIAVNALNPPPSDIACRNIPGEVSYGYVQTFSGFGVVQPVPLLGADHTRFRKHNRPYR